MDRRKFLTKNATTENSWKGPFLLTNGDHVLSSYKNMKKKKAGCRTVSRATRKLDLQEVNGQELEKKSVKAPMNIELEGSKTTTNSSQTSPHIRNDYSTVSLKPKNDRREKKCGWVCVSISLLGYEVCQKYAAVCSIAYHGTYSDKLSQTTVK